MTREPPSGGEITSARAFRETLARLLRSAHRNGVAVEGGWECRNGDELPDWEAVVLELTEAEGGDR